MRFPTILLGFVFFSLSFLPGRVLPAAADISGSVNGFQIRDNLITLELSREPQLRQHRNVPPERLAKFKVEALERLIERELLFNEAKRRKLVPSGRVVEENVARAARSLGGQAKLKELLKEGDLSVAQYTDWIRKDLAATALRETLYLSATTDEARQHYAQRGTDFVQPASANVQMILTPLAPLATTTEVTDAERRSLAVATEWAADPATAPSQLAERFQSRFINMGKVHEGSVVEGVSETVFALAPGQVSAPLRTIYGWHVVRVLERFPQRQLTFEEVAPVIRANLTKKRGNEAYSDLLEALRGKSVVKRNF